MVRIALLVLAAVAQASASVEVMKDVTLGFGEAFTKCREESGLTEDKMEEFFMFWRDDFRFEHRELGCALLCMSRHFDLLTAEHRMHHENMDRFVKTFPNGEVLAKQIVEIIHSCELKFEEEADHCWRVLHTAECFKMECQRRGFAPAMEMVLVELVMEAEP